MMITDEDLVPFEFSDFWEDDDVDSDNASTNGFVPEYVVSQISRIPHYGDDARWRLASHLDMFEDLNPDGSLTPEQREAVNNFAAGYQANPSECVATEFDFPECQYVAHGADLDTAIEFAESWRRGEYLPIVGQPELDQVSRNLKEMTNQRLPLEK